MLEQLSSNDFLQILPELGSNISLPVLLTAILGLLFILLAFSRFRQHRLMSAVLSALSGTVLVCLGALLLAVSLNIHTYQRLTYEHPVAELKFSQLATRLYQVDLKVPDNPVLKQYLLLGDEWQLDARILRWSPFLQLLGLNTQYRLERLSGRYHDDEMERSQPRSVYSITTDAGLDIWSLARDFQPWLPWIDAYYGSATYLPMRDGARFIVSINQYGLIARSGNAEAEEAIYKWR